MSTNQPLAPKTKNKMSSLIIMASVAMFLGLIAAVGIWQYLSKTQEKVKQLSVTKAVVVASKQIPAGTKLTEEYLTIKQFPIQAVPKDYPSSIQLIKGRIVMSTIQLDEVITESRLIGAGTAGGLSVVIPPNQRAITIKVNEVIGVGGFINPGDRIDIVSILRKDKNTLSKTILQNVLILAVGDKIFDPDNLSEIGTKIVSQITVALSSKDSEKLSLASEAGQLQLVLRPHVENTIASTEGITLEDVYGYFASEPSKTSNSQVLPPFPVTIPTSSVLPKNGIEIILGNQRTYQYF